ncbi:TlpA family protein disulfide reductase [Nitrosococcus wardiae]|uniref:TlpA family protein disulfide reductase n=1 Tax=Nitrosococcus wardiae TaxID=1814290 RepID=A0A4P7C1Q8_9GAMM|nr:TlpA disulfide reductase family protein [Nitrosococcus wardiae]QBQ54822.1 TlpA family protein disulfide reductase [Nitrosococcus wardiae]
MNKLRPALFCLLLATIPLQTLAISEIKREAPNCTLNTLGAAEQITIQQWQGKVIYVDFWASWCPPCVKSFPFLNNLYQHFSDEGLQVLGVNLDEKLSDAEDFLAKFPTHFDIVIDPDQECAQLFDVQAMPSSFLVDRNGMIRYVHKGFRSGDVEKLRAQIQKLLKEEAANS